MFLSILAGLLGAITGVMSPNFAQGQCIRERDLQFQEAAIKVSREYELVIKDGAVVDTLLKYWTLYNDKGRPVLSATFDSVGDVPYWHENIYDEGSNQFLEISYNKNGYVWTYNYGVYDEKGNCVETGQINPAGDTLIRTFKTYDNRNRPIETVSLRDSGISTRSEYLYDDTIRSSQWIEYDASGRIYAMWIKYYDSVGNDILYFRPVEGSRGYPTFVEWDGSDRSTTFVYDVIIDMESKLPDLGPEASRTEKFYHPSGLVLSRHEYVKDVLIDADLYEYLQFDDPRCQMPEELREWIWKDVWLGFIDKQQIVARLYGSTKYKINPDEVELGVEISRASMLKNRALMRNDFDSSSDFYQLADAFDILHTDGIIALHNTEFDESDSIALAEKVIARTKRNDLLGYCFYRKQDLERLIPERSTEDITLQPGTLYISFGSINGSEESTKSVGAQVVARLKEAGLTVEWNGDADERIQVQNVVWDKRPDGEDWLESRSLNLLKK